MPRPLPAASSLRTSLSPSINPQHIWISDALLNESLHNYFHSHRRYGSSVPGPLEARRRATKRRNTNLAHAGHGTAPVDASLFLGNTSATAWWQPPQELPTEQRSSLLPSWLFHSAEPPRTPPRRDKPDKIEHDARLEETEQRTRESQFFWLTGTEPTAKSIQDAFHTLHIRQTARPRLIELAFNRLLERVQNSIPENVAPISEFLLDPTLNCADSKHHLVLIKKLCRYPVPEETWETALLPATTRAIQLGLVSDKNLRAIIDSIPKLRKVLRSKSDVGVTVFRDWHKILNAIAESKVLALSDLGSKFLKNWYDDVQTRSEASIADTTEILHRIASNPGRTHADIAAELLTRPLRSEDRQEAKNHDIAIASIQSLPASMRTEVILITTLKLVEMSTRDQDERHLLSWARTLRQLSQKDIADLFCDEHIWARASDTPSILTPMQKVVSLSWVATRFTKSYRALRQIFESLQMHQHFRNAVVRSVTETPDQDEALRQIGIALESLPLPDRLDVYRALQHYPNHNLMSVMGHKAYEKDIAAMMEHDFQRLNDETFYRWAKTNRRADLVKLAESANWNLPAFVGMSQSVISRNKEYMKIIRRIFEHNTAFQIALSRWSEYHAKQEHEYGGTSAAITILCQHEGGRAKNRKQDHGLNPVEAVEIINRLAVTAAVSPVIGARSAFRQVYYFYCMLNRCGAPILPTMTRALWHAGVTRYGEDSAPYDQVRWCLSRTERAEGMNVARALKQSPAYRRDVRDDMEAYARRLHALVRDDENVFTSNARSVSGAQRIISAVDPGQSPSQSHITNQDGTSVRKERESSVASV